MAFGVEGLKLLVTIVAGVVSSVEKVIKGNFLAAWGVVEAVMKLRSVDFATLKKELADLDATERAAVEKAFKDALVLDDKSLEVKIEEVVDLVEQAVAAGVAGLAVVDRVKALVAQVKALFS